jgi:carotenoid cleavage dioxygenase-like enzyme
MNQPVRDPDAPFGREFGAYITDVFAPVLEEEVHTDLPVTGEIPTDLNGVYLRNGPNPRFEPKGDYHPFDGDGMLHSAHFEKGQLTIRNKWIRTEAWQREAESGHAEYWGIRQTLKGREDQPIKDSANTDVIGHAGAAIANWYLAGTPYAIDPITLETLGPRQSYLDALGSGMSAHCKVDQKTGELMYFDYSDQWPYMWYGVVDKHGQMTHRTPIELPGNRLPHDMAITENYSILHDHPVYHDEEAREAGRHKVLFNSSMPSRLGVIPRKGDGESIRWFDFSGAFIYHVINAWELGDEIVMVACRYMPARHPDGSFDDARTAKMIARLMMDARLWEYRMSLVTGECSERCLDAEHNVEFPSYDAGKTGRYTQYAYLVDHDPQILRWSGVCKYNTETGERLSAWTDDEAHCWYSEPWFAPADDQQREDHGYLVVFVWNDKAKTQELQVFDAADLSTGPIARVHMPRRIPPGFHACWMPSAQIG